MGSMAIVRLVLAASELVPEPAFKNERSYRRNLHALPKSCGSGGRSVIGQIIGLARPTLEAFAAALCDEPLVRFADRASERPSSRSGQYRHTRCDYYSVGARNLKATFMRSARRDFEGSQDELCDGFPTGRAATGAV
jgi:hypothetical protein